MQKLVVSWGHNIQVKIGLMDKTNVSIHPSIYPPWFQVIQAGRGVRLLPVCLVLQELLTGRGYLGILWGKRQRVRVKEEGVVKNVIQGICADYFKSMKKRHKTY